MNPTVYQFKESGKKFIAEDWDFKRGKAYHIGVMEGEDGKWYDQYFTFNEMNEWIKTGEVKRIA